MYVYHLDVLNHTVLSQVYGLEKGSHCGNSRQSVHSKDRGRGEEALIVQVLLKGQPQVTSF